MPRSSHECAWSVGDRLFFCAAGGTQRCSSRWLPWARWHARSLRRAWETPTPWPPPGVPPAPAKAFQSTPGLRAWATRGMLRNLYFPQTATHRSQPMSPIGVGWRRRCFRVSSVGGFRLRPQPRDQLPKLGRVANSIEITFLKLRANRPPASLAGIGQSCHRLVGEVGSFASGHYGLRVGFELGQQRRSPSSLEPARGLCAVSLTEGSNAFRSSSAALFACTARTRGQTQ